MVAALRLRSPFAHRWLPLLCLYLCQLDFNLALVRASGKQGLLTKEEASAGFVSPLFLSFHLQHHLYATNFFSYGVFQLGHSLFAGVFGSRDTKAVVMAAVPGFLYLILRDRFGVSPTYTFFAALAAGLSPGLLGFSWLGTEYGLETVVGLLALWLAFDDRPVFTFVSSGLAAAAAEMYGPGLAFLGAVLFVQVLRFRWPGLRLRMAASISIAFLTLLIPVFWCHNLQTLFIGGGGKPTLAGSSSRVVSLLGEIFMASDSYYAFLNGRAAIGPALAAILAIAGAVLAAVHFRRAVAPLAVVAGITLGLCALAPQVPGVRRAVPLIALLCLCAGITIHRLSKASARLVRLSAPSLLAIWLALNSASAWTLRRELGTGIIPLPHDFTFAITPGSNMEASIDAMVDGRERWPNDWSRYEPDRTLAILYTLSRQHPALSGPQVIAICQSKGFALPADQPRFYWLRRRL